ncbi:MFS transporter [Corynebacterium uterequi]|uniref:Sugar phosphate permease n=1 Tax=Corynebacterium uterequi TaxID=1072256 RepID=A0A0G3HG07_9CORY|nr:MFS transporter [Corynebacterium uterequi]AKK11660.1 sugar phosphate permease [Corynebacterium uterequi]
MDIRSRIDSSPMSTRQWLIIAVAAFVNALDGYDIVAMAFSSTAVVEEFGLSGTHLGWLLSSALVSIGVGSVALAPLADRFGRRRLVLISLTLTLAGLLLTAVASSTAALFAYRLLTGVGVGGILTCMTVVASEYSNRRYRGLAVAIYASGYGLGATLCGLIAARFIPRFGWEAVFYSGALLTLAAMILVALVMPASPASLIANGQESDATAPLTTPTRSAASSPAAILTPQFRRTTLLLWLGFAVITFAFNFANQWTPKLLTEAGLSAQQGILGGIMLSFGGTLGSLIFGALTIRFSARTVLFSYALAGAGMLVAFISTAGTSVLMFAAGVAVGMLLNGCVTGMYTVTPLAYPENLRATGVGTAIGISRAGAILGPVLVGYLVDAGWSPAALYGGASTVLLLAAAAAFALPAPFSAATTPAAKRADSSVLVG